MTTIQLNRNQSVKCCLLGGRRAGKKKLLKASNFCSIHQLLSVHARSRKIICTCNKGVKKRWLMERGVKGMDNLDKGGRNGKECSFHRQLSLNGRPMADDQWVFELIHFFFFLLPLLPFKGYSTFFYLSLWCCLIRFGDEQGDSVRTLSFDSPPSRWVESGKKQYQFLGAHRKGRKKLTIKRVH